MREFLALEQHCDGKRVPGTFKNFLRGGGWLGDCAGHALACEVRQRYSAVLLAVARQLLAEFSAAQPEADVEAMLQTKDFPVSQLFKEGLAAV